MKMKDIRAIIEDESLDETAKIKRILDLHHGETDDLREKLETAESDLKKAQDAETAAKTAKENAETALNDYKAEQGKKETRAAKADAAREYFKSKGISTDKSIALAIRSCSAEIDALELDKDGKIKDSKALDDLIEGDLSGLVVNTTNHGTDTKNPPKSGGTPGKYASKEDIMKIRDTAERQKAIAEQPELFGI